MATNQPDSFLAKQGSTQEEADHTEPDPVYLSEDSGPEEEEPTFTSGAPGFASLTSFAQSTYIQNPAFQTRNSEIATMKTVVDPEEDRKLSRPSSSSKNEFGSHFEPESESRSEPENKPKKNR